MQNISEVLSSLHIWIKKGDRKVKKFFYRLGTVVIALELLCVQFNNKVYATTHSFDFITDGKKKNSKLEAYGSKTRLLSTSWYKLLLSISIVLMALAIIFLGINLALSSKEEKAETKRRLLPVVIASCGIFAVVTLVGVFYSIGQKIF